MCDVQQDQQHEFDIFRNEIEFYQKILPDMTNFLVNEGFAQETADLFDVPDMLYAGEEEDGAIIILQDILSDGYKHIKVDNITNQRIYVHIYIYICNYKLDTVKKIGVF